ncbi:MAG: hypothetical protein DRQ89_11390 [Epsilonproteobacteria bacterium]|nr:MAG: hypothetical protein DRQ89_11390 [Campylobacterota bacterium]
MKKIIVIITTLLFFSTNIQAGSKGQQDEVNKCFKKYNKIALGGNIAGAGAIVGGFAVGAAVSAVIFPPLGLAGLGAGALAAVILLPIAKSYAKSLEVLVDAYKFHNTGNVAPKFRKVFKRRDRKDNSLMLNGQRNLFTDRSMEKWCTHPLYDYLTLRRKIRNGSIYGSGKY